MHIYKFRLLSDKNDDFVRDIEIQAVQTFEDFHKAIAGSTHLNGNNLSSFHICDQKWNKLKEITLIDMLEGHEVDEEEESRQIEETFIMKDAKIKDFINEPHQRLLYEYDFLNLSTIYIELLSVHKQKEEQDYPICTLSKGDLKEEPMPEMIFDEDDDFDEQLLQDFDELLDDTFEYKGDSDTTSLS
ncbi:MAG: hypothetical protein R2764_09655 [Bacteroidales bacterium]